MSSIAKYGHSCFNSLFKQLNEFRDSDDPEILHKIRVDLKKIKALFNLINFCSKKFDVSERYKPLRKIFKKAGATREFDIMNEILHQYKIMGSNADLISRKNSQQNCIVEFRKGILHYKKIAKKCEKKIAPYYAKVRIKYLKEYILKKEKELNEKLSLRFKLNELHDDRKIIKEIIYLSSIKNDESIHVTHYDKLQNVIGDWHDKQVIIEIFKSKNNNLYAPVIETLEKKSKNDIKKLSGLISK